MTTATPAFIRYCNKYQTPRTNNISLTALDAALLEACDGNRYEYDKAKARIFPNNKISGLITELAQAYRREIALALDPTSDAAILADFPAEPMEDDPRADLDY